MKIFIVLITVCFSSASAFCQASIQGTVYYLNSNKVAAKGVEIKANGSNGVYSKSDGSYILKFPHKNVGDMVRISIGEKVIIDEESRPIELVNTDVLKSVNIPLNPDLASIRIIVCPKGFRDAIAQKYYNILKTSADKALKEKKSEINSLQLKLGKAHRLVNEKQKQLALFIRRNKDTVALYKEAYTIASINRDYASDRVKRYLDKLDLGIEIEEARKQLNSKKAFEEIKEEELNLDASMLEIAFDAQNRNGQDKFQFVLKKYDSLNTLMRGKLLNPIQLIDNLLLQGQVCHIKGSNEKAIAYYKEAQRLLHNYKYYATKKILISNNLSLLRGDGTYNTHIMNVFNSTPSTKEQITMNAFFDKNGKAILFEDILQYRIKARVFLDTSKEQEFEKLTHNSEAVRALIQNNIGISQYMNAHFEKAEMSLLDALAINEQLASTNPSNYNYYLARTYLNLAHLKAQDYKKKVRRKTKILGLKYIEKSKALLNNYDIETVTIKKLLLMLTTIERTFK